MTDNGGSIIALFLRKRFLFLFFALAFAEAKNATEFTTTTETDVAVTAESGAQRVALKNFCTSINGTWSPTTTSCFKYYITVEKTWENAHKGCTNDTRVVSGIRGRLAFIPNEAVYNIMKTIVIYGSWIALKPRDPLNTTEYNGTGNNFPYKSEYVFYEDDRISADLCWVPPNIHVLVTKRQSVSCMHFSKRAGRYWNIPCQQKCRFTCEYVLDVPNSSSRDSEKCETVETTTITTTSAVEEISSTVPLQQFTTVALKKFCISINGTWSPTTSSCFKYYLTVFETRKKAYEICTSDTRVCGIRGRLPFIPNEAVYNIMKTVVIHGSWIALIPRDPLNTTEFRGTGNNFPYKSEWVFYEDDRISEDLSWLPPTIHVNVTKRQSVYCMLLHFSNVVGSSRNKTERYSSKTCESKYRFTCEYVLDGMLQAELCIPNSSSRDSEKCETVEPTTISTASAVEEISSTVPSQQFTSVALKKFCVSINGTLSPTTRSCFKYYSVSKTWKKAQDRCTSDTRVVSGIRGRLAFIPNEAVFNIMKTIVTSNYRSWIALKPRDPLKATGYSGPGHNFIYKSEWVFCEDDRISADLCWVPPNIYVYVAKHHVFCMHFQNDGKAGKYENIPCKAKRRFTCEYSLNVLNSSSRDSKKCETVETTTITATPAVVEEISSDVLSQQFTTVTSSKTIVDVITNKIQPGTMGVTRKTTTLIAGGEQETTADQSPHTGYASETTASSIAGKTTTWATMDKVASTTATTTTIGSPTSSTPAFPMSEVEEVVAKVFQTLGCTFILGALSLTLGAFLLLRDFSYERFLHMNQEISLLIAHILIMTARDKTDMPVLCKSVAIILHLTFMAAFNFLMLEALQTYAIMTSVVIRGGYFNRRQFFVIGWGGPALIAGVSALLMHDNYIAHYSCWLNFDSRVAFATTVPICVLFSAAFVMAEAASMGYYPKIPGYDKNQATAAVANQKALFLLLPLNLASWLCGAIAVHYANFAMYSLVSALNMSLGIAIFVFHSLGNPKVWHTYLFFICIYFLVFLVYLYIGSCIVQKGLVKIFLKWQVKWLWLILSYGSHSFLYIIPSKKTSTGVF